MAFLIYFLLFLRDIELSEEVESYNCVNVDHDGQEHDSQYL